MIKIKDTVAGVYKDLTTHWNKPQEGYFVSYKEILNFGVGGMGQQFVTMLLGYLGFGVGNTLLGSTLGIRPMHLQYMVMVQTVLNVFFYIIRGKIVDNTRTSWGRFRPYIAIMGFPLVILTSIFIFLPFDTMPYNSRLIASFAFGIATSMISPFFTDTYSEMATVISPNSQERAKVISIQSILFSAAPTLTGFLIPIFSNMTGGYTDIRTYRFVIVPFAVVGVSLNLFTAFGCKERTVTAASYVQKIGVVEGCCEIYKNKYWWLRSASGWLGFLEGACGSMLLWIYMYSTQDMTTYAFVNTIIGTASGIAMLVTPWLLSKLGNRKLLLMHNGLNIILLALMATTFKTPLVFCVFWYVNAFLNALPLVYNQVMHSEVKDYQQYISRKRMDFMFGTAGMISMPITLISGLLTPYVYECMGLTTNYDILYDPNVRNTLFLVLCLMSILGAALNLIPFMFYNLSREKHRNIIKVLEYRAMLDDEEHQCLKPERIKTVVEGVREALAIESAPMPDLKEIKRKAKAEKAQAGLSKEEKKAAVRAARKSVADAKKLIEQKGAVNILMDEINQYDQPEKMRLARQAEQLTAMGIDHLGDLDSRVLEEAKALPHGTKEEKMIRKADIRRAKKLLKMAKAIRRYYPNGAQEPDESQLNAALAMPNGNRQENAARSKAIKEAEQKLQLYHKTYRPYLDALETVRLSKNSKAIYQKVEAMYEEACQEVERKKEAERLKEEENSRQKELVKQGRKK